MPNQYTHDGNKCYIVAGGRTYECNVPHPMPVPDGISGHERDTNGMAMIVVGPDEYGKWTLCGDPSNHTHWLARAPLPEVPRPKTQEEKDEEAYRDWLESPSGPGPIVRNAWFAALAHARQQQP